MTTQTDQSKNGKIITQLEKLIKANQTIKDTEIKIQLKTGHLPTKQRITPLPYHSKNFVEKEKNKVFKSRYLEKKKQKVNEKCSASPVVTVKIDKSLKIASD